MKNILIYGLQRSGTNYLEKLLLKNYAVKLLNSNRHRERPIHKHFRLYDNKNLIPEPKYYNELTFESFSDFENSLGISKSLDAILVISKDPFSWFLSYSRWSKKCEWPKVEYHYIEEYKYFYQKWLEFYEQDDRINFIRYLDLLSDPEKELDRIQNTAQLKLNRTRTILGKIMKLNSVSQSKKFGSERYNYYINKEYMNDLTTTEIDLIKQKTGNELMNKLRYSV